MLNNLFKFTIMLKKHIPINNHYIVKNENEVLIFADKKLARYIFFYGELF
jgi:hypothetical protein